MFSRLAKFARSPRYDRDRLRAFLDFTWQRFLEERCPQAAGALSFTSVFALVPLTAAILGILAAFPVFAPWREQLTNFVFQNFVPAAGTAVQGYITEFAANASKATVVGVLVLLFSAVALMMSIEDAFNRIWRVSTRRTAAGRFIVYWTALTLGPLLLVAALAISSYVFALPFIDAAASQFSLKARLLSMAPFLIIWAAMVSSYMVIPNRSVHLRHAVPGALLAAILFELAKRAFTLYVSRYASYEQIYGALAMVPIFIIWIYVSWIIVLLGASITASLSAFDYRPSGLRMPQGQEFAGLLRVLGHFVTAHREGRGLHSKELLAAEPYLTDDLLQRYLGDLNRVHIAQRTEVGEWVLSRDPAATRLVELYEEGGYRLPLAPQPLPGAERTSDLLVRLGEAVRDRLDVTLSEYFPAIDKPGPRSADTAAPPTRPPGDPT